MGILTDRKRINQARAQWNRCFYCALRLHADDQTWEHLVARAHGGSNRISNLRVAHGACNSLVGTLPLAVKLALSEIGHRYGSDAFFLIAGALKPLANGRAYPGLRRRPKPPPAHVRAATLLKLVEYLPADHPTRVQAELDVAA
jgi:hypothetical protein